MIFPSWGIIIFYAAAGWWSGKSRAAADGIGEWRRRLTAAVTARRISLSKSLLISSTILFHKFPHAVLAALGNLVLQQHNGRSQIHIRLQIFQKLRLRRSAALSRSAPWHPTVQSLPDLYQIMSAHHLTIG